jgi:hypothetical protein
MVFLLRDLLGLRAAGDGFSRGREKRHAGRVRSNSDYRTWQTVFATAWAKVLAMVFMFTVTP